MKLVLRLSSLLVCLLATLAIGVPSPARAAVLDSPLSHNELRSLLRQVIHEDPSLILDILRENSELVFEIAQQGLNQRNLKDLANQWKTQLDTPRPMTLENRPVRGAANAPVTLVAFSDFTCPFCTKAAQALSTILPGDKRVRFIFKHFPLEGHRYARIAAEYHVAATFQNAEKAWAFYDALFKSGGDLNEMGESLLTKVASEAGLDIKQLNADLRNKAAQIRALIDEDIAEGKALGLQGTPNFFVNNLLVRGALPADLFKQAITMAYEHSKKR